MTKELAEFLRDATNHCGQQEIDVRENYSGRGMYDRTTYAVVVDNPMELMINVVQHIRETIENMEDQGKNFRLYEFIPEVSDVAALRTDSMGRSGTVIY